jgi:hypothetical protein
VQRCDEYLIRRVKGIEERICECYGKIFPTCINFVRKKEKKRKEKKRKAKKKKRKKKQIYARKIKVVSMIFLIRFS